jgi:16S rRNA (adenine1518-N6/adenine1519-N6)-dimethyltransferase
MPLIPHELLEPFFKLIKAGFSQKRKTLRNSLSAGLSISTESATELLNGAGINPMRRAETLSIEEWQRLSEKI